MAQTRLFEARSDEDKLSMCGGGGQSNQSGHVCTLNGGIGGFLGQNYQAISPMTLLHNDDQISVKKNQD